MAFRLYLGLSEAACTLGSMLHFAHTMKLNTPMFDIMIGGTYFFYAQNKTKT